jgi:hypothetical protein
MIVARLCGVEIHSLFQGRGHEISNGRELKDFQIPLNALAIRSRMLLNLSDISSTVGMSRETLRRCAEDFSGLRNQQSFVGERFRRGVLLHTGDSAISPSKDLFALPFGAL